MNSPKGFRDFVGKEASKRKKILSIIEETFSLYGFQWAETPTIEREEFVRENNPNDEAVRDIFKLQDRGKRKLALRHELTFQLRRLSKNKKLPFKVYRIGNCFRDEPIRKGRLREFTQADIDVVGSSIKDEAECIAIGKKIFSKLGIKTRIFINNRKMMNEILADERIPERHREQAIREIDKLDKLSKKEVADNLKKINSEKIIRVFEKNEKYFERYRFYEEIRKLSNFCKKYGVEVEFKPTMSRGLSYYNGSVFEFWSDDLDVSLAGGGSYLVEEKQSTGLSFGIVPISLLAKVKLEDRTILLISLSEKLEEKAIALAERLREEKIPINTILNKSLSKALEYANSYSIKKAIILGEREAEEKKLRLKDLETGEEKLISESEIINTKF